MGKFAEVTAWLLDKTWLLDWKVTHGNISNGHSCGFPQKVKSRHKMYEKSQLWILQKSQMKYHISSRHVSSPQDTLPQYEIVHWKCYIPEIHHSEKQRFLGVSRKLRFGFNSHFYRGIWVFRCGSFGGHSAAFSVEYVILEMDHWVILVSTWFVIQSRLSNFACATINGDIGE